MKNSLKNGRGFEWSIDSKPTLNSNIFSEIWSYRDLLSLLVKRDIITFYKQTILGPLWFFIQPLLTTIVFTFVFGNLGGFSTDGIPQPLFYLAGITFWNYFSDCLIKTSTVFRDNSNLFSKVYFPRIIIPFSIVISSLVKFSVQFILFMLMSLYYFIFLHQSSQINEFVLLFPLLLLIMALLGLGIGMLVSALTTKYRDLSFLISFAVQLLMYTTTVVYPLSFVGSKIHWIVLLNPMTALIETFRFGFFGVATFHWGYLLYSFFIALMLFIIGSILFNKVERSFVDTI